MQHIGIGLIGCGYMGVYLAKLLLAVDSRLQIRGLYDPDDRSIKNALELTSGNATVFENYHDLLDSRDIDWVMISF